MSSKTAALSLAVLALLLSCLSFSSSVAGEPDIIFTGCPPYVEGYHCDSIFYQVVAVDLNTGKSVKGVKYHLIDGKGTINEITGLWQYHPELAAVGPEQFDVEIAASFRGDTTSTEDNCSFTVYIRDRNPRLYPVSGAHISILPGETFSAVCTAFDYDECDEYAFSLGSVTPQPAGELQFDPATAELYFAPAQADAGGDFEVTVVATNDFESHSLDITFEIYERDPVAVKLSAGGFVEHLDTVTVPLTIGPSEFHPERLEFDIAYNDSLLRLIGIDPGSAFFDTAAGTDWRYFNASTFTSGDARVIRMYAYADHRENPDAFAPTDSEVVFATMRFQVRGGDTLGDVTAPLDFYWRDYRSNAFIDDINGVVAYGKTCYDADGNSRVFDSLPGYSIDCDTCFLANFDWGAEYDRYQWLEFHSSSVTIARRPFGGQGYSVNIEVDSGQTGLGAIQGQFTNVTVSLDNYDLYQGLGGFDLLFAYDQAGLNFSEAIEGPIYEDCDWEYFMFRYGPDGNCGDDCPSGMVRVIGIGETNNGPYHPTCDVDTIPIELFDLVFLVSNDRTFECQHVPVSFYWMDCGDNTISNRDGSRIYINDRILPPYGDSSIADGAVDFPTYLGAQDICLTEALPGKPLPDRDIDFRNGGVQIVCADSIDARGDINLNNVAYEIADLVLFIQLYFANLGLPDGWSFEQRVVSDVNADGITNSLSDLFYLNAVVIGDAPPYDHLGSTSWHVNIWSDAHSSTVRFEAPEDVLGLLLVIEGDVTPTSTNEDNQFYRYFDGINTRMLFLGGEYSFDNIEDPISGNTLIGFSGEEPEILYAEAITYYGQPVSTEVGIPLDADDDDDLLPTEFALHQNYPNPFNPETQIAFSLSDPSFVTFEIYNVMGQKVRTLFEGQQPAGEHLILWDATDDTGSKVASGIYLYRLIAGEEVATRKMLLLK